MGYSSKKATLNQEIKRRNSCEIYFVEHSFDIVSAVELDRQFCQLPWRKCCGALTPVQCIDYALARPGVAAVMAGCRSRDELDAALAWCDAAPAERNYAEVLAGLDRFSWQGHCMYCGHCAPCTAFRNVTRRGAPERENAGTRRAVRMPGEVRTAPDARRKTTV